MRIKKYQQKLIKGGMWFSSFNIFQRVLDVIKTIILARFLQPREFGLIGISILLLESIDIFFQIGVHKQLIQKQGTIEKDLDLSWTILVVRGFVLCVILLLIAPWAANFFSEPRIMAIAPFLGFIFVLRGLENIKSVAFDRTFKFNKRFIYNLSSSLPDFLATVMAVFILRNFWAIIIGMTVGSAVQLIVGYILIPHKPRFRFELNKAKRMIAFGKWISCSSILHCLIKGTGNFYSGKMLGLMQLGFYQLAYRIPNMLTEDVVQVTNAVLFPVYSRLQDKPEQLRKISFIALQYSLVLILPFTGAVYLLAGDFTKVFLGEKWLPIVPAVQILVFLAPARVIGIITGSFFLAVARPDIITKLQLGQFTLLLSLIFPLGKYFAVEGVAAAVTFSSLISSFTGFGIMFSLMKVGYGSLKKIFAVPTMGTMGMMLWILFIKSYIVTSVDISGFLFISSSCIFIYTSIVYLLNTLFGYPLQKFDTINLLEIN